jgi:hypothetical protein
MKVKELINELSKLDPNWVVVLSADEEGNSYSELDGLDTNAIFANRQVYIRELTGNLEEAGYGVDDQYHGKNGKNAVVLYPK